MSLGFLHEGSIALTDPSAEAHQQDGEQAGTTHDAAARAAEAQQPHAHDVSDPKDNRSLSSTLEATRQAEKQEELDAAAEQPRPTDLAKAVRASSQRAGLTMQHGNKPSRGAVIDEQIENEERAELERKGKA